MPSKFVTQLDTRRRKSPAPSCFFKTSQNGHRKWATLLHVLVVAVAVVGVVNRNRITCQLPHTKLWEGLRQVRPECPECPECPDCGHGTWGPFSQAFSFWGGFSVPAFSTFYFFADSLKRAEFVAHEFNLWDSQLFWLPKRKCCCQ